MAAARTKDCASNHSWTTCWATCRITLCGLASDSQACLIYAFEGSNETRRPPSWLPRPLSHRRLASRSAISHNKPLHRRRPYHNRHPHQQHLQKLSHRLHRAQQHHSIMLHPLLQTTPPPYHRIFTTTTVSHMKHQRHSPPARLHHSCLPKPSRYSNARHTITSRSQSVNLPSIVWNVSLCAVSLICTFLPSPEAIHSRITWHCLSILMADSSSLSLSLSSAALLSLHY